MMSPDKHNHGRAKPTSSNTKDETLMNSNNNNTAKQPSSSSSPSIQDHHHQPQHLNCPRCDSPNTKFCYYNNYSLTQPRHFCKTCRRYWTKGGALRNVPVGGGCRKNKKIKRSSSSPSSILFSGAARGGDSFQGFLSPAAIDYQLGGSDSVSSLSARSLYNSTSNNFLSFGEMTHHNNSALNNNPSCFTITNDNSSGNPNLLDGSLSMGFDNYPKPQPQGGDHHQHNNHGGVHVRGGSSLTSSIESLSSINLNLHLKLQQQRMALLIGVGVGGGGDQNQQHDQHEAAAHHHVPTSTSFDDIIIEKRPQSILFQDLEISRVESNTEFGDHHVSRNGAAGSTTEWFFDSNNPYSQAAHQLRVTTADPNVNDDSQNWSSGIQAWSDLPQYNALH